MTTGFYKADKIHAVSSTPPAIEDVAATLRGIPELSAAQLEKVLRSLHSAGHVTGDLEAGRAMFASAAPRPGVQLRTPLAACEESSNNLALVQNLQARCRRIGYQLKMAESVDMFELNKCMASSNMSSDHRISLKTDLAKLRLID